MTVPNPLVVLGVPTEGRSASMSVLTMAPRVTVRSVTAFAQRDEGQRER